MKGGNIFNVRKTIWALVLTMGLVTSALALDDGCYCVGPDYLAYEFNDLETPGHRFYTLDLNVDNRFGKLEELEIEAFQVQGMRCLPEAVDLLAWDRIYRVERDGKSAMKIHRVEPQPDDSVIPDFTSENLLGSRRVIPLKNPHGRESFELVIEPMSAVSGSGQETLRRIKITLRKKDAAGVTINEQVVFAGSREEPID